MPKWKKIISVSENKQSLTSFLCEYLVKHAPSKLSGHPEWKLVLAGGFKDGKEVQCVLSSGSEHVYDSYSTQEEADTRMLLHAVHASHGFEASNIDGRVVIKSPDTDVLVLPYTTSTV